MCQLIEHLARMFFPAHCTCMNFFWYDGLVQEFFSYAYALAGYFFSKSPTPPPLPPSEVKWSAPYIKKSVYVCGIYMPPVDRAVKTKIRLYPMLTTIFNRKWAFNKLQATRVRSARLFVVLILAIELSRKRFCFLDMYNSIQ